MVPVFMGADHGIQPSAGGLHDIGDRLADAIRPLRLGGMDAAIQKQVEGIAIGLAQRQQETIADTQPIHADA